MGKTHQKRDDKWTLCGLHLDYIHPEIVELPEEVTCKNCISAMAPPSPISRKGNI